MQGKTIGIIGTGEMGSAVAKRLADGFCSVVVSVEGRSDVSRRRVADLGIATAPSTAQVVAHADLVLSIVPPAQAESAARAVAAALASAPRFLTYVDCNAVAPATVRGIETLVRSAHAAFVDAGIIGGPPRHGAAGPIVFVSGEALDDMLALRATGLDVRALAGGVGQASALKMSYAGITKGLTALGALMQRHARTADLDAELRAALRETRPDLWHFLEPAIPAMMPKAYRWVAEMREIAAFTTPDEAARAVYEGIAAFYERVVDEAAVINGV